MRHLFCGEIETVGGNPVSFIVNDIPNEPNSSQFTDKPPSQIVPELADQGTYLASESSFYRILRAEKQLAHRGRAKAPSHSKPDKLVATGPDQLWSWDITYLPTTVKGLFFYLYLIMDIYSRKIVGWEVFTEQSADYAAITFQKAYLRQSVAGKPLILHSDNGLAHEGGNHARDPAKARRHAIVFQAVSEQ